MNDLSNLRVSQEIPANRSCGLRAALNVVAGKWKPLVLWHLLPGPKRSVTLLREIEGISDKVFHEQLKELETDGIVARTVISEKPLTVTYELTPLGQTLAPLLAIMSRWGFDNIIKPHSVNPV